LLEGNVLSWRSALTAPSIFIQCEKKTLGDSARWKGGWEWGWEVRVMRVWQGLCGGGGRKSNSMVSGATVVIVDMVNLVIKVFMVVVVLWFVWFLWFLWL
jgi:hypothetical protein